MSQWNKSVKLNFKKIILKEIIVSLVIQVCQGKHSFNLYTFWTHFLQQVIHKK